MEAMAEDGEHIFIENQQDGVASAAREDTPMGDGEA